jgi:DNA-binding CsgD family transcriptional regulator/PAS domain-containing protein
MDRRKENSLIEALYDAALGYRPWIDVNRDLKDHIGGHSLMMSVHHPKTAHVNVLGWLGMSPESQQEYAVFAPHDVWVTGYIERRLFGTAAIGSHVVDEPTLTRSFIYNEYLRPNRVGIHHLVGTVLPMDGGYQAALGIHRPRDAKDFTSVDGKRLERLLPHVQRALEVHCRLHQVDHARRSVYSVLDRLSLGVIVLNTNGRLLHVNATADAILRKADGLTRTPDGLRAARKDDDRRLQQTIDALRRGSAETPAAGGHLRVQRPSGQPAYAVMVAPAGPGIVGREQGSPAVIVFVSNPGKKLAADLAVMADLFGLPPAEARLVLALMSGKQLPEIARDAGVTYHTVRTQIARAMARTETRTQVELVLLVSRALGGVEPGAMGGDEA